MSFTIGTTIDVLCWVSETPPNSANSKKELCWQEGILVALNARKENEHLVLFEKYNVFVLASPYDDSVDVHSHLKELYSKGGRQLKNGDLIRDSLEVYSSDKYTIADVISKYKEKTQCSLLEKLSSFIATRLPQLHKLIQKQDLS